MMIEIDRRVSLGKSPEAPWLLVSDNAPPALDTWRAAPEGVNVWLRRSFAPSPPQENATLRSSALLSLD